MVVFFVGINLVSAGNLLQNITGNYSNNVSLNNQSLANFTAQVYDNTWLDFDGIDDNVILENQLSIPSQDITTIIKFKSNNNTGSHNLFSQKWGTKIYIYDDVLYFVSANDSALARSSLWNNGIDKNWSFIAGTYNDTSGNQTMYEDQYNTTYKVGVNPVKTSISKAGEGLFAEDDWVIGSNYQGSYGDYFNGSIDFIKTYNRTLSGDEINHLLWNDGEYVRPVETKNLAQKGFNWILNDGSLLVLFQNKTYFSNDNGGTFVNNYNFTESSCNGIYQDLNNYTYIGCMDELYRSPPNGDGSYNLTKFSIVLTMPFSENYFWHGHGMSESSDGHYTFFATYGDMNPGDHSGIVYRSSDNFETCETIYNDSMDARHIHFVKVDPYSDYVYVSVGDSTPTHQNATYLLRSVDNGTTWVKLQEYMDLGYFWQPTTLIFTQEYRIYGEDVSLGYSKIFRTSDDVNYETVFEHDITGWWYDAVKDSNDVMYFSYYQADKTVIVASEDNGTTWYIAREYEYQGYPAGTIGMSNANENSDYFYFKGILNSGENTIRAKTLAKTEDDAIWHYNFNENNGTVAHNLGVNGINGTINGSGWGNDGTLKSLRNLADYILYPIEGTFKLINEIYNYVPIFLSYDIDTIAPQVIIVYPTNISYNTNVSVLNYTFIELNSDKCWWSNNGGGWNSTAMACGTNWTGLVSSEGINTWTVYINDTVGNLNSTSITFFKDTLSPNIIINSPLSEQSFTTSSILLNATLNENGTCLYSFDAGVTNTSMESSDNQTFTKSLSLPDGDYVTNFYCNDTIGNVNNTQNVSFSISAPVTETTAQSGSSGSPIYYPTESNLRQGYSRQLGRFWKLDFKSGTESHQLKIDNLNADNKTATITISSEPQTKTLSVGEEWKVNLDDDNFYDLLVRLDNVTSIRADIFIQEINEEIKSEILKKDKTLTGKIVDDIKENNPWFYPTIVTIILIAAGLIFTVLRKVGKKGKEFSSSINTPNTIRGKA